MKNIYIIYALLICALSHAQIVNIPDTNFKNALLNHDPVIDTNGDGEIQVNEAEATLSLNVSSQNIVSLSGIEYFTNLLNLNCSHNNITDLDLSQNINLEGLGCNSNFITNLSLNNNTSLKNLSCYSNQLISLDLSQNHNLESLGATNNQLVDINLSNATNIWYLRIDNNNLENIDVSDCLALAWVFAAHNQLESFDISQNPNVHYLDLNNNNLTSINIKNNNMHSITLIDTRLNPNLGCIMVDNINYPATRHCDGNSDFWCMGPPIWNPNSYYSEDCSLNAEGFTKVEFDVYSNPVKDILTVNSQETINFLKIYSTDGKLLIETTESRINVSELASGFYLVMVSIDGRKGIKKFIKS